MFEHHHLIHYDFREHTPNNKKQIIEKYYDPVLIQSYEANSQEVTEPMDNADFLISGSTDVLPFYPQTTEDLAKYMYVQSFSYMKSDRSYYTKRYDYNSFLLCFTHAGKGQLQYEGMEYTLSSGDLFIIDCKKKHFYKTIGPSWEHSDLHVSGKFLEILYEEYLSDNDGLCVKENVTNVYLEKLDHLLTAVQMPSKHRALAISNQIENLLVAIIQLNPEKSSFICDETEQRIIYLIQFLQHHYAEDLSLDFLADFSGISKYYLTRIFHEYTGFAPNEYIIQIRMQHASYLLTTTNLPIKSIGAIVGIENEAYFSRLFKKRYGEAPGVYRKKKTPNHRRPHS